jgi:uncharacterized protein
MQLMQMVIDGLDFARRGNRVCGQVAVAELSRVAGYLANTDGALDCNLQGGRSKDGSGYYELRLVIQGTLHLRCQRCLEAMQFPLQLDKALRLMASAADWPDEELEEEAFDALEASHEMVVGTLIEDEVLLALPISPRHESCAPPQQKDTKQDASPFAVLRKLKID